MQGCREGGHRSPPEADEDGRPTENAADGLLWTGSLAVILIVGLGNPGKKYAKTRHNIGYLVIDRFSRDHSISLTSRKFSARVGKGTISGAKVVLAKPRTFMNLSGISVGPLAGYFTRKSSDLIVIHDDLDLPFGRIKVKMGGGDGGHKGLRSIIDSLGASDFIRVRVGIDRPPEGMTSTDYVLQGFSAGDKKDLEGIVVRACRAVEMILADGVTGAMNEFNR